MALISNILKPFFLSTEENLRLLTNLKINVQISGLRHEIYEDNSILKTNEIKQQ
jgi:hypothetical protein